MYLIQAGVDKVRIALDNDATNKAIKLMRQYEGVIDLEVIPLDKDPKDMNEQELNEVFKT